MKVILTEKVRALGNVGDIVNVAPGHARNFLLPNGVALVADEKNSKVLEDRKRRLMKKVDEEKKGALEIKKKLDAVSLEIVKRVGGSGKLFGTVTTAEIAKLLEDKGIEIERRMINISTPIRALGVFEIKAKIFSDVEAKFKIKVSMDEAQAQELKRKEIEALARKKEAKEKGPEEVVAAAEGEETASEE